MKKLGRNNDTLMAMPSAYPVGSGRRLSTDKEAVVKKVETGGKLKKKPRYLVNEIREGRYVRAWKVGRDEIAVDIWNGPTPDGEAPHSWGMPSVLGVEGSVAQAMVQSRVK